MGFGNFPNRGNAKRKGNGPQKGWIAQAVPIQKKEWPKVRISAEIPDNNR